MRLVAAVHDLACALLAGGIAGVGLSIGVVFGRAPSREIAGQIGNALFGRLAPLLLGLGVILLAARLWMNRAEAPSGVRTASTLLAGVIVAVAAVDALWLTPAMSAIWSGAAHAADGSGLTGVERGRFLALHGVSNLAHLAMMLLAAALIVLRATRRA